MKKEVNQIKIGAIMSYAQMGLNIIIGIIYTPVMLRLLGKSEYGLYNLVSSTISMLGLLSLGLGSGYVRYFAKYKANKDDESIYKLNGLYLTIYSVIGVVALICGLFLSFNLSLVFKEGLTSSEYSTARILMLLLTFNMATTFPLSVFSSIISANEKYFFIKTTNMISTVVSPLVTLPLLLMGYRSIAMVVVSVTLSLIMSSIRIYYVFCKLNQKFVFRNYEKGILKSLFAYCAFIALNMVVDQINTNIDKLLLGRYKGTESISIYSVGFSLYNYYLTFSTSVSSVFTPRVHKLVVENKSNRTIQRSVLTELFTRVGRIQFAILALIGSGLIFFGRQFILNFWAGEGYDHSYVVLLFLMIPATIPLIQNIGIEIQRAQNLHRFRSLIYVFMAFINLGTSIVLCQKFGAIGCAIGTAISYVVANGIIMNIYYHKKCNINIISFWKSIIKMLRGLIIPIGIGVLVSKYFHLTTVFTFLCGIAVYSAIYCLSMYFLAFNDYERNLVNAPIRRIISLTRR